MYKFFRFMAVLVGAAGVFIGFVFIVEAQPEETYGDTNTMLVVYGVVVILAGFLWSATWWALAEMLKTLRAIAKKLGLREPDSSSSSEVTKRFADKEE